MVSDASPLQRARAALEGLALGDAFGQRFFYYRDPEALQRRLAERRVPDATPWTWTDDTAMALSVVEVLAGRGAIDGYELSQAFARRYDAEPRRGYGGGAHELLDALTRGAHWHTEAHALFGGTGSFGNGAAMRVAPLGAWFAGDPSRAAAEARASAEVTHAHIEGIAGGVAVAVGAALMADGHAGGDALLREVARHLDATETRDGVLAAADLPASTDVVAAAQQLGCGRRVSAMDTVPFTLWVAAHGGDDYEDALWRTASALGDVDTTCAIVGGLVGARVGLDGLPADWLARREPLPEEVVALWA